MNHKVSYGVIACLLLRLDKAGDEWQGVEQLASHLQLPIDTARHHLEQLFVDGIVRVKRNQESGQIEEVKSALVDEVPAGQISSDVLVLMLLKLEPVGAVWTAVPDLCEALKLTAERARLHLEQLYVDGIVRVKRHDDTGEIEAVMCALPREERLCA